MTTTSENVFIRKACPTDLDAGETIYTELHQAEEDNLISVGWKRGIYPVRSTAEEALFELRLDTNERNKAARAMYAKLGYKEISMYLLHLTGYQGLIWCSWRRRYDVFYIYTDI